MSENFEMLLNKGNSLNKLSQLSSTLKEDSKKFKKDAHKLKMSFWLRKYATFIAVGGVLVFFLYLRFFIF